MHQTVLLVMGYFVVGRAIPDLVKLGVIGLSSFALIKLTYEFLVRRSNRVRILFGTKPRPRTLPPAASWPLPQLTRIDGCDPSAAQPGIPARRYPQSGSTFTNTTIRRCKPIGAQFLYGTRHSHLLEQARWI